MKDQGHCTAKLFRFFACQNHWENHLHHSAQYSFLCALTFCQFLTAVKKLEIVEVCVGSRITFTSRCSLVSYKTSEPLRGSGRVLDTSFYPYLIFSCCVQVHLLLASHCLAFSYKSTT